MILALVTVCGNLFAVCACLACHLKGRRHHGVGSSEPCGARVRGGDALLSVTGGVVLQGASVVARREKG